MGGVRADIFTCLNLHVIMWPAGVRSGCAERWSPVKPRGLRKRKCGGGAAPKARAKLPRRRRSKPPVERAYLELNRIRGDGHQYLKKGPHVAVLIARF